MLRSLLLPLLVLAFLAPQVASQAAAPYAPKAVFAASVEPQAALVSWLPGEEAADAFLVYGLNAAGTTLLIDTSETGTPLALSVVVPAGFDTYGVSGVKMGQESGVVLALECLYVEPDVPPEVGLTQCKKTNPALSLRRP